MKKPSFAEKFGRNGAFGASEAFGAGRLENLKRLRDLNELKEPFSVFRGEGEAGGEEKKVLMLFLDPRRSLSPRRRGQG